LGDESGILYLKSAFNVSDEIIRGIAGIKLAQLRDESIAHDLVEILAGDESIDLKFQATRALVILSQ